MAKFIVITQEQAEQFEAAGIPVDIQYTVSVEALQAASAKPAAPLPKATNKARPMSYPNSMPLRWTGISWRGTNGTQLHGAYLLLKGYFEGAAAGFTPTRKELNGYLSKRFTDNKTVFNSSVLTHMCEQKYLEPAPKAK